MKNILLIIASLVLISCTPTTNTSEVDPAGSHLGGVKGGGTEADRETISSGQGKASN